MSRVHRMPNVDPTPRRGWLGIGWRVRLPVPEGRDVRVRGLRKDVVLTLALMRVARHMEGLGATFLPGLGFALPVDEERAKAMGFDIPGRRERVETPVASGAYFVEECRKGHFHVSLLVDGVDLDSPIMSPDSWATEEEAWDAGRAVAEAFLSGQADVSDMDESLRDKLPFYRTTGTDRAGPYL